MPKQKIKKDRLECKICGKTAYFPCPNCFNFNYCSIAHMEQHKKTGHGASCKAIKGEKINSVDKLVATRDIDQGEIILREKPIMVGPGLPFFAFEQNFAQFRICLGCYKKVSIRNICSLCDWPVCNEVCEKNYWHKYFECEVFRTWQFKFDLTAQYTYCMINVLRLYLLKEKQPETWKILINKIIQFSKHPKANCPEERITGMGKYIKGLFKAWRLDFDLSRIRGVLRTLENYSYTTEYCHNMYATYLFESGLKIHHDCVPNTYSVIYRQEKAEKVGKKVKKRKGEKVSMRIEDRRENMEIGMYIYAAVGISKGEPLTRVTQYFEGHLINLGTQCRRERLFRIFGIECKCRRCSDPTELGSFMSAIKCKAPDCQGTILNTTPLLFTSHSSVWKCNTCPKPVSFSLEEIMKYIDGKTDGVLQQMREEEKKVCAIPELQEIIGRRTVMDYIGREMHPNHSALWTTKEALISKIGLQLIALERGTNIEREYYLSEELLVIARDMVLITNKISPGFNPTRAKLMYYLAKGCRTFNALRGCGLPELLNLVDRMEIEALNILGNLYQNFTLGRAYTPLGAMIEDLERSVECTPLQDIAKLFQEDE